MLYANTLNALDALEYTDLDTEVDFSRIINEIDNNTIDSYELIETEEFITLGSWILTEVGDKYLDKLNMLDMLDKEIDKVLSEGEI